MFSGALAAKTIKSLLETDPSAKTVVLFGADHTGSAVKGEVWDAGAWKTPLGELPIDEQIAAELIAADSSLRSNPHAHNFEHSIEVQTPLLLEANSEIRFVPIAVPAAPVAVQVGQAVGRLLQPKGPQNVIVLGSTDLTHHGGHFGNPGGHGTDSEAFARKNDQRMIELMRQLAAEDVVPEANQHKNACGAGAIAATLAAVREMGARKGVVLDYTNSYQILREQTSHVQDDTTVGYASVVFV
jgi:hypothetical protein